jgi:hypothetical protein
MCPIRTNDQKPAAPLRNTVNENFSGQGPAGFADRRESSRAQRRQIDRVQSATRPAGDSVIQLMTDHEIEEIFEESNFFVAVESTDLAPEVKGTITERTTAWEDLGKNVYHREWRNAYLKKMIAIKLGDLYQESSDPQGTFDHIAGDVEYWKAYLPELFAAGENRFKPDTQKIKGQYKKLDEVSGIPPINQRIFVQVAMGQGSAGDLKRFIFHSGGFSTCSAIALYNGHDNTGGLFHYAAQNESQAAKLMEMHDDIRPTYVGMAVNTPEDLVAIQKLFSPLKVDQVQSGSDSHSLFLTNTGQLAFTTGSVDSETAYLNLTGMTELPGGLGNEFPLKMYHEPQAYGEGFEVLPP